MATQYNDFTLQAYGSLDPKDVQSVAKVVVPDDCWLREVAVHTETGIDTDWLISMKVNAVALTSPTVVAVFAAAELVDNGGHVFDMHESTATSGASPTPIKNRPRLKAGDSVTFGSDGVPATGANAWFTYTFRRSSM